jgi:hypothetical protein
MEDIDELAKKVTKQMQKSLKISTPTVKTKSKPVEEPPIEDEPPPMEDDQPPVENEDDIIPEKEPGKPWALEETVDDKVIPMLSKRQFYIIYNEVRLIVQREYSRNYYAKHPEKMRQKAIAKYRENADIKTRVAEGKRPIGRPRKD